VQLQIGYLSVYKFLSWNRYSDEQIFQNQSGLLSIEQTFWLREPTKYPFYQLHLGGLISPKIFPQR
jgi:hypothetical protein